MKKGSMLTALLLAMVMCFSGFAVAESMPVVDDLVLTPDEQTTAGSEVTTLSAYEMLQLQAQAAQMYNDMVATTTLADFYAQLESAYYADETVRALFTVDQTNALYAHADALYALEDPENEDAYNLYEEVSALIAWVFGERDAATFIALPNSDKTFASNTTIDGGTITGKYTWTLNNGVTLTLNGTVTIGPGAELNIVCSGGTATIKRGNCNSHMFVVGNADSDDKHARLRIQGSSGNIIVDGGAVWNKDDPREGDRTNSGKKQNGSVIRCFNDLTLSKMTIRNNDTTGEGGAILFASGGQGDANIGSNVTIEKCCATSGGAIMISGSFAAKDDGDTDTYGFQISGVTFQYNEANSGDTGGIIRTNGGVSGTYLFSDCTIKRNYSRFSGGGFYWNAAGSKETLLTVSGGTITENKANSGGGAMFETPVSLSGVTITKNVAIQNGGGVFLTSYGGNAAGHDGEGFRLTLGTGVNISSNEATYGGGIYGSINYQTDLYGNKDGNVEFYLNVAGASIENNTATQMGGGIYIVDKAPATAKGYVQGNTNTTAYNVEYVRSMTLSSGTIKGNKAPVGGGVCIDKGNYDSKHTAGGKMTVTVSGSVDVSGNQAQTGAGGGIYISNKTAGDIKFSSTGGSITSNNASTAGGGVYLNNTGTGASEVMVTGGSIKSNKAKNGAGIYVNGGDFEISNGTVSMNGLDAAENVIAERGGAVYVSGGDFTMNGGTMASNEATIEGGAVYLTGGNFLMKNGTIGGSEAANGNSAQNGGAVYVNGGNFTMENGVVNNNSATAGGGAIYLHGGNFHMDYGQINNNKANNGGAVYLAGTSTTTFEMLSGFMNKNEAVQLTSGSGDLGGDGGAIYATSGTLKIGVNGCKGKDDVSEHVNGRSHPVIQENEADDCGGGISISNEGVVHFYCGVANENIAKFKGVGMNVFMVGGTFSLYDGAELGSYHEPELVVIGGTLNDMTVDKTLIRLQYYQTQDSDEIYLEGLAEKDEWVDLPDGEYFMTKPSSDVTFFGWTAKAGEDLNVRKKADYLPSGTVISITDIEAETVALNQNTFDGKEDEKMNLYALWAPSKSKITYVDGLTYEIIAEHQPDEYELHPERVYNTYIPAVVKPGYAVVGWYIYQDEGKDANWGFEPYYTGDGTVRDYAHLDFAKLEELDQYLELESRDADLVLNTGTQLFGDITLVAKFVPMFGKLEITKLPATAEGNFIFRITGDPSDSSLADVDMYVTAKAGENNAVLITELPVGTYTVTEQTDWSWRYQPSANGINVTIDDPATVEELTFTNEQTNFLWLDDEDAVHNVLGTPAPVTTGTPADN